MKFGGFGSKDTANINCSLLVPKLELLMDESLPKKSAQSNVHGRGFPANLRAPISNSHQTQSHLVQQLGTQSHIHLMPATSQNHLIKSPPYRCNQCGKIYQWKQSLSLHQRLECGKEPQFQCPHCPLRSKQKGSLLRHISNKHPNSS
ncbi:Longitudinals lacking protein, isoform G [Frankliniella fusca]|uniref:Longitudinals lacking protein, isoform G n=1 Tax=Frankliniella fusca TaxID=407009 RepID=A0AAE1LE66_9NEOP|nr:Longitudinals lacking protein, isoform G [Frankliniella fusca]